MKVLHVVVMYPPDHLARALAALRHAGMAAQGCLSRTGLLALLQDQPCDAVVLDVSVLGEDAPVLIANLRRADRLGIVVSGRGLDAEGRLRALECGADICLPAGSDDRELVYSLRALGRRLQWAEGQAVAAAFQPPARQWELRDQDWTLVAPDGQEFALSANERILVRTLWQIKGRTVSRDELADALLQDNGRVRAVGPRSVDVLVSRLRRRLARSGCILPVRTVYGSGYLFVDEP